MNPDQQYELLFPMTKIQNQNYLQKYVNDEEIVAKGLFIGQNQIRVGQVPLQIKKTIFHVQWYTIKQLHVPADDRNLDINEAPITPYIIGISYLRRIAQGNTNLILRDGRFGGMELTENMSAIFNKLVNQTIGHEDSLSGILYICDTQVPLSLINRLEHKQAILVGKQIMNSYGSARLVSEKYVFFALNHADDDMKAKADAVVRNLYSFTDIRLYDQNRNTHYRFTITTRGFSDLQSVIGITNNGVHGIGIYNGGGKNADLPNDRRQVKILVCVKFQQKHLDVALYKLAKGLRSRNYDLEAMTHIVRDLEDFPNVLNECYHNRKSKVPQSAWVFSTISSNLEEQLTKYHFIVASVGYFKKIQRRDYPSLMTIPIYVDHNIEIFGNQQYSLFQFGGEVMEILRNADIVIGDILTDPPRGNRRVLP